MSLAASQTDAPSRRRLSASSVMMVASLVLLASPTLIVIARQSWTDEQSQQGPLVLALGVWLFWRGWPDALAGGARGGLAASVAGMAVCGAAYCLGRLSELSLLEGYGLFGFGLASVYALTGVYGLRRAAFPLMLIGFAMPVPFMVGWPVTTALRLAISDITVQFMRACHVPASRDGLTLYLSSYRIEIAQACSGMNSLLALTALSICYVHLRRDPPVRYLLVLFPLVVIGAVAANLIRVLLLATLTLVAGDGVAQSSMHQLLGLATFAFALLMTFAADEALGRTAWAHRSLEPG